MHKYSTIFLFPGAVGYLLAAALKRTGRKVLTISAPTVSKPPAPALLGSSVYFPDVFLTDMAASGFPEPSLTVRQQVAMHLGGRKVLIDPDAARQIIGLAAALPGISRELMAILKPLQDEAEHLQPKLGALYKTMPSKLALGRKLMRKPLIAHLASDPLGKLPADEEGEIARWALRLPAYLGLGLQGYAAGRRALAAGYSIRSPYFAGIDFRNLTIDSEHLYIVEGGDFIELEPGARVEVSFTHGPSGAMTVDGSRIVFERVAFGRDAAAHNLAGHPGFREAPGGLMLLSHTFSWKPPKGFDTSGPMHGVVVADLKRPPVNDNLVLYSIYPDDSGDYRVTTGVTVERAETLSEHFREKRRGYIMARMVSNFVSALGGESDSEPIPPPLHTVPLTVATPGRFRFYDDSLHPGCTLEDLVRSARWHSMHSGFAS